MHQSHNKFIRGNRSQWPLTPADLSVCDVRLSVLSFRSHNKAAWPRSIPHANEFIAALLVAISGNLSVSCHTEHATACCISNQVSSELRDQPTTDQNTGGRLMLEAGHTPISYRGRVSHILTFWQMRSLSTQRGCQNISRWSPQNPIRTGVFTRLDSGYSEARPLGAGVKEKCPWWRQIFLS